MFLDLVLAMALAAGTAASPARTAVPAAPAARATPAPSRAFVGAIQAIDLPLATVVVRETVHTEKRGGTPHPLETVTLKLDASTHVLRGKKPAKLEELKVGDYVVVRYLVTPQGSRAVSLRAADVPRPAGTATPSASATGAASN